MLNLRYFLCCLLIVVVVKIDLINSKEKQLTASEEKKEIESWTLNWFPHPPHQFKQKNKSSENLKNHAESNICDDGVHSINIDFDPANIQHSYNYLCLANRTLYQPDLQREPILFEHIVPMAYVPPVKCMNETIIYEQRLPTFGAFRLVPPKYGTYLYIPPQRWLHSLAEGAVVLLYHPCATKSQIDLLSNMLKACLYRHVITTSQRLSAERPLALLSWGKCLQMSVVDKQIVENFIKENAKHGPIQTKNLTQDGNYYEAGHLSEAALVTDINDSNLCGFSEM